MLKRKLNNKGFTLIELIAVIAILLIIMAIAMPSITSLLGRTNDKISKEKEKVFISAAKEYVSDNYNTILPSGSNSCIVSLYTLNELGYLSQKSYEDTKGNKYEGYITYKYINNKDEYSYTSGTGTTTCTIS